MVGRLWLAIFVTVSTLASVIVIARANDLPGHDGALAVNTCALPCFFGMLPGETPRAMAVEIVDDVTLGDWSELNNDIFFSIRDSLGRRLLVTLDFWSPPVSTLRAIRLSPRDAGARLLRLGDFLRTRDSATVEMRACESTITRVSIGLESGIHLNAALMARDHLTPGDPLIMLDISSIRRPRSPYDANPFGCHQIEGWRGFAPFFSLTRYAP